MRNTLKYTSVMNVTEKKCIRCIKVYFSPLRSQTEFSFPRAREVRKYTQIHLIHSDQIEHEEEKYTSSQLVAS